MSYLDSSLQPSKISWYETIQQQLAMFLLPINSQPEVRFVNEQSKKEWNICEDIISKHVSAWHHLVWIWYHFCFYLATYSLKHLNIISSPLFEMCCYHLLGSSSITFEKKFTGFDVNYQSSTNSWIRFSLKIVFPVKAFSSNRKTL